MKRRNGLKCLLLMCFIASSFTVFSQQDTLRSVHLGGQATYEYKGKHDLGVGLNFIIAPNLTKSSLIYSGSVDGFILFGNGGSSYFGQRLNMDVELWLKREAIILPNSGISIEHFSNSIQIWWRGGVNINRLLYMNYQYLLHPSPSDYVWQNKHSISLSIKLNMTLFEALYYGERQFNAPK